MARDNVPKIKRQEVWYNYIGDTIGKTKCFCCSLNDITQFEFHCGHIVAKSNGGDFSIENLRPICSKCNLSMGNENMIEFMKRLKYDITKIISKPNSNVNLDLNICSDSIKKEYKHIWSESDDLNIYLCYRFGDMFPIKETSKKTNISIGSIKMKISNFKSLEGEGISKLTNCSEQAKKIFFKYKDMCLEQILDKPIEIKYIIRQNQWGVSTDVFETVKFTKKLICPWGHTKKICDLFDKSEFNDKKFSKIFINDVKINDYMILVDREYKTGLVIKIISEAKSEISNNVFVLRKNNICEHIPIECDKCSSSVKMVFTSEYFKYNPDKFIEYLNEDYHFEKMHSIMRNVEIIGELSNSNEVYQKYKCLQSSICSTNRLNLVNIKDINFLNNEKNVIDVGLKLKSKNNLESITNLEPITNLQLENTSQIKSNNKVLLDNKKEKKNKSMSVFNLL